MPSPKIEATARLVPAEVTALLSALQLNETRTTLLKFLSDEEWLKLLSFCEIAHLTLPLAQLPMDGFPLWVVERLITNLSDNAIRFESIKKTYEEVAAALNGAGVDYVVIKGFTQAPDYVTAPHLRAQSDIDLFCPPECIDAAQSALQAIGYEPSGNITLAADHQPALVRLGEWQWRGNPFDADMPLGIELHFCLWNERVSLLQVPEVQLFWDRRTTRVVDGLSFPCLNPVDQLGHLALHILRNLLLTDWIVHHVRELAVFLNSHANDNGFWLSWSETHSPSLRSLEAIAFYHAQAWFGCRLHPLVEHELSSLPATQQSWLHRFSGSALEVMFRQNKDSLWLHLTLLSSHRQRWKILRKTLVPPRIAPINSPTVKVRNKRLVQSAGAPLWRQYLNYVISRSVSHGHATLTALTRGLRWRLSQHRLAPQLWIFLAASFFIDLGLSIYYFLFNLFLLGHGYNEKTLGLLTGAMAVGGLIGALPAGRLAQRIGLRPVMLTCLLLAVIVASARALLLGFPCQLSFAFVAGLALSTWAVCVSPVVAQLTDKKQRPLAFSLLFSLGIGLGAIGGLAGSRLPGWIAGHHLFTNLLQPPQLVLLLSSAIVALAVWPTTKLTLTRPSLPQSARPLLSPFLLRYLPAIAVWSLVTGSFSPLASVYLSRHIHMSLPQIGDAFSLSQLAQVVTVLAAPALFRRLGLVAGIVSTQIAASILLLMLANIGHPLAATAVYVAFSAFQWMGQPGLYSLLMNMVPVEERGGASASNMLVMSAAQVVAATFAGAAFTRYGYTPVLRGIACLALLSAVLFWNLQSQSQRGPSLTFDDVPS